MPHWHFDNITHPPILMLTDSLKSTRYYWDFMLCWNQHDSKSLPWDTRDSSYLSVVQECRRKHAPGKWHEQVWKKITEKPLCSSKPPNFFCMWAAGNLSLAHLVTQEEPVLQQRRRRKDIQMERENREQGFRGYRKKAKKEIRREKEKQFLNFLFWIFGYISMFNVHTLFGERGRPGKYGITGFTVPHYQRWKHWAQYCFPGGEGLRERFFWEQHHLIYKQCLNIYSKTNWAFIKMFRAEVSIA